MQVCTVLLSALLIVSSGIVLKKVLTNGCKKKKAELIREKISESDIPFQEIAMDFDFNSQAHFTSYCKRLFGMTPSKLRTESKRIDASDLGY